MHIYYKQLGGHYHMRVFINGAKMGDLCCREDEFPDVKRNIYAMWHEESEIKERKDADDMYRIKP